jgi:hypothetical protein
MPSKEPRQYKVVFTSTTGHKLETKPLTWAQADHKMRCTEWSPGSNPAIVKVA